MRYVPRIDGDNGNWQKVEVAYSESKTINNWETVGTYNLSGGGSYDFQLGEAGLDVARVRFRILEGKGGWASAAEVEAYVEDNTKRDAFAAYFEDDLFTVLKPEVTSSEGIEDKDVKTLVDNLLADAEGYKKFRVGEYEPYRHYSSLQSELKTSAPYNQWENPTGIYVKPGDSFYVMVSGIASDMVGLKVKNWVQNENGSTYGLRNGLNKITATTEGNVFVDYYTDNYKNAPNAEVGQVGFRHLHPHSFLRLPLLRKQWWLGVPNLEPPSKRDTSDLETHTHIFHSSVFPEMCFQFSRGFIAINTFS